MNCRSNNILPPLAKCDYNVGFDHGIFLSRYVCPRSPEPVLLIGHACDEPKTSNAPCMQSAEPAHPNPSRMSTVSKVKKNVSVWTMVMRAVTASVFSPAIDAVSLQSPRLSYQ